MMNLGFPRTDAFQQMLQLASESFVEPDGTKNIRHHGIMTLILYLVGYAGLRRSEVVNLRVFDVDLKKCTVELGSLAHKRLVPLDLFPNMALYKELESYILHGRPQCDSRILESTDILLLHLDENPVSQEFVMLTFNQLKKKGFLGHTNLRLEFRRCLFEKGIEWGRLSEITGRSVPTLKSELEVRC